MAFLKFYVAGKEEPAPFKNDCVYDDIGFVAEKDNLFAERNTVLPTGEYNNLDDPDVDTLTQGFSINSSDENSFFYPGKKRTIYIYRESSFNEFIKSQASGQGKRFIIVNLSAQHLREVFDSLTKRALDIIISVGVIVFILSWFYPLIGIIIKLQSKGPVFFRQIRTGKNNVSFWCYKFRSMSLNKNSDVQQACKNDPRITRIGAFLRKTSLDELPQFFNVLIGDMSVVGPRPHMLRHTEYYEKLIYRYNDRHHLKPGITGWAQINGYRGETKELELMQKRVEHDLWYIRHRSLKLDIKIIFQTFKHSLAGKHNGL